MSVQDPMPKRDTLLPTVSKHGLLGRIDAVPTHPAEHTCDLEDEVELRTPGYLARALGGLQRLRLELREEQCEARVVVVRVADLGDQDVYS